MKAEYQVIIDLVKSAITGEKVTVLENTDWLSVLKIAKSHQILPMVYYGLINSKIQTPYDDRILSSVMLTSAVGIQQVDAIEKIKNCFTQNDIYHSFLKGSRLKFLYPKPEMRIMGDLDVLIKQEQYEQIKPLMLELGFTEGTVYDYEYHWKQGNTNIELHNRIISKSHTIFSEFFDDGWKHMKPSAENEYLFELPLEVELAFIFAHLVKHYRTYGIGLRHFIDIFVFISKYPEIDWAVLEKCLNKLELWNFFLNVREALDCWFNHKPATEAVEIITERVFKSNSFGNNETRSVAKAMLDVKETGDVSTAKKQAVLQSVFLPLKGMKVRYPVLVKAPFLLPVMWVVRWVTALFMPSHIKAHIQNNSKYEESVLNDFEESLKKVGL